MLGMSTLLSPKAGMNIVKAAIEKTIKAEMHDFDVIYKHEEKVIDFRFYNYTDENKVFHKKLLVKYADGEKLCSVIHNMLKKETKVGDKISYAIVNYKTMICTLLLIRNNEKTTQKIQL